MDTASLKILTLEENPERHEQAIVGQQSDPNPAIQALLESTYLDKDRAAAFERFRAGLEFRTMLRLFDTFGVRKDAALCEIGGGAGFLSWALSRSGYTHVNLLEPNSLHNTGTGYLRSREDAAKVRIQNDLNTWHAGSDAYDVIITKNCIHHFKNIAQAAASIRQKMKPGARWFAFREQFADNAKELYELLSTHPYCQAFSLYEWSYPASHYVEAMEMAGFSLTAAIPAGYANNTLAVYRNDPGGPEVQQLTDQIDGLLRTNPTATAHAFWDEVLRNRFQQGTARFFSRPPLMVFELKAI